MLDIFGPFIMKLDNYKTVRNIIVKAFTFIWPSFVAIFLTKVVKLETPEILKEHALKIKLVLWASIDLFPPRLWRQMRLIMTLIGEDKNKSRLHLL